MHPEAGQLHRNCPPSPNSNLPLIKIPNFWLFFFYLLQQGAWFVTDTRQGRRRQLSEQAGGNVNSTGQGTRLAGRKEFRIRLRGAQGRRRSAVAPGTQWGCVGRKEVIAAEVLLWRLPDTLGSRGRKKERKKKSREVYACLLLCFSRASLALLDRRYFSAIITQVCFPYVSSNKSKCQKSYYFPWKEACLEVRAQGFLGWVIPYGASCKDGCSCSSSGHGLAKQGERQSRARQTGARGKELQWQMRLTDLV